MKGFTVIEILVAVGIIMLTTGLLFVNWQSAKGHLSLERAVSQVAQDITRAQELSLRSQVFLCSSGSISGYGIYFDVVTPSSYILFAECNGDNTYQSGVDGVVEKITLEKGVFFTQLVPTPNWSIVFVPPEPQIFLKPGDPSQVNVVLGLEQDASFKKTINVNARGVIDTALGAPPPIFGETPPPPKKKR